MFSAGTIRVAFSCSQRHALSSHMWAFLGVERTVNTPGTCRLTTLRTFRAGRRGASPQCCRCASSKIYILLYACHSVARGPQYPTFHQCAGFCSAITLLIERMARLNFLHLASLACMYLLNAVPQNTSKPFPATLGSSERQCMTSPSITVLRRKQRVSKLERVGLAGQFYAGYGMLADSSNDI